MRTKRYVLVFLVVLQSGCFARIKKEVISEPVKKEVVSEPVKKEVISEPEKNGFRGIGISNGVKELGIGTSVPMSGSLYKLGTDLTNGMGIFFNDFNKKGGVLGHRIKLIVRDDSYEKSQIRKNVDDIFLQTSILFGTFSSDTLDVIEPEKLNDYLILFPLAGASVFRRPENKNLFFFRPSTIEETKALVDYAVFTLYKKRVAIFYEDSFWGRDGANKTKEYIESLGASKAECVEMASYVRNTVKVDEAVDKIVKQSPEVVILVALYRPAYSFIKKMVNKEQEKVTYMGVSDVALIQDYLEKSRGVSLITTSVVPNPWTSKLPIALDYRAAMKKHLPNYRLSLISFEGYISAALVADRLQKITTVLSKESIIASLEECKEYDFRGLSLTFDPQRRALFDSMWLNVGEKLDWQMVKVGKTERERIAVKEGNEGKN